MQRRGGRNTAQQASVVCDVLLAALALAVSVVSVVTMNARHFQGMVDARNAARQAKDWPLADQLRGELDGLGVVLMDGPQGTSWRMTVS